MRNPSICIGTLVLLISTATLHAQQYRISLSRPDKQGDSYSISATGNSKETDAISAGGAAPQKQERAIDIQLDGAVHVLEVKNDKTTKLTCTVQKCVMNGKPAIAAGTVLTAENINGKTVVTIDGKPIDPSLSDGIVLVVATDDPTQTVGNEEMFGATDPKKVGDTWPVNSQAVATGISKDSPPVGKNDVTGTVKLEDVKKVDGKDAEVIHAQATINVPPGKLPDGPDFDKANITIDYSCVNPADAAGKSLSETMSMHITTHIKSTTQDGQPLVGDVTVDRTAKIDYGAAK